MMESVHSHALHGATLLEAHGLVKHFPIGRGWLSRIVGTVHAVDDVSLTIARGEILGLVGESGCGKSTLGRLLLNLLPATAGTVLYDGTDITRLDRAAMRPFRKRMQIIFQDPRASLNPRMPVETILREALTAHAIVPADGIGGRIAELLTRVGLDPGLVRRFPHEFSSGQRQRIGIARALAVDPTFIVCDEPVSALDVSIQAQILNLLLDLRAAYGLSYLFISHDLTVVHHMADRIAVMYLGRIVEMGPSRSIAAGPLHPYTDSLVGSAAVPDPERPRLLPPLSGEIPSPVDIPSGCAFRTRCPRRFDACAGIQPRLAELAPGHFVSCLLHDRCWPDPRDPKAHAPAMNAL